MIRRPPKSTRTDTLFPYTTLFRSLIKAAAWPLNFWLPAAYANACAPVGAVFAIMTKVGIYALLRIGSLLLPTGAPAAFGGEWMFPLGMATLIFGTVGILAAPQAERQAGYCIIMSSGRSEERRVGKGCVSPCRSRWAPYH